MLFFSIYSRDESRVHPYANHNQGWGPVQHCQSLFEGKQTYFILPFKAFLMCEKNFFLSLLEGKK
jgi:hypothetical protein